MSHNKQSRFLKFAAVVILSFTVAMIPSLSVAQGLTQNAPSRITDQNKYQANELVEAGHKFFGGTSANIASVIETMFSKSGNPNAYIIGEEGSGSFVLGLRYGEGYIYFRDGTRYKIFWQGPSLGFDFGADASKTMVLVYGITDPNQLIQRFPGVDGSAYIIGGIGVTYQRANDISLGVIRSGVGARLGINIGYLKYSAEPDWNPF